MDVNKAHAAGETCNRIGNAELKRFALLFAVFGARPVNVPIFRCITAVIPSSVTPFCSML